jgi:hypothetical protein
MLYLHRPKVLRNDLYYNKIREFLIKIETEAVSFLINDKISFLLIFSMTFEQIFVRNINRESENLE